jgi:acyl-CoA reductase-like NAD-dependent aldehyde dehydrogenase
MQNGYTCKLQDRYQLYIGGEWRDASDGATFKTYCPATGEVLAECAQATKEDVDDAVKAAWKAWDSWKTTSPAERAKYLNAIADAIDANAEQLIQVESADNGKPVREATFVDVPETAGMYRYYAGIIQGEEGTAQMINNDTLSIILHEPIGVVGEIVPWNFPFTIASWKMAPALAAGCCIVFKPSSSTSLSVLELTKLIAEILPPGVFNLVTGSGSKSGQYILEHPDIRKLSFTGSTQVGYNVAHNAADKVIPATLELGGKSANIYFEDCDWDAAIDGAQMGILWNEGQVCCAGSRILVQESIYDKFVEDLAAAFDKVKVGMPWKMDTQMGSIISEGQLNKVLEYVDIGKAEGARVAAGGTRLTDGELANGNFMRPTLLADVTNDMRVAREEIFGPVACVIKFKDEADAIRIANDNDYGLGGGVWTKDISRAIRVARAVQTGRMWINQYNTMPAGAPFGGYKKSGYGRELCKETLGYYSET